MQRFISIILIFSVSPVVQPTALAILPATAAARTRVMTHEPSYAVF